MNTKRQRNKKGQFARDLRLCGWFLFTIGFIFVSVISSMEINTIYHKIAHSIGLAVHVQNAEANTWQDQVFQILEDSGQNVDLWNRLADCESKWNPNATNKNHNGTTDYGLWQLNSVHGYPKSEMLDPITSTYLALQLAQDRGLDSWTCYSHKLITK